MEFSLCCKFSKEKISYKIYTLTNIKSLPKEQAKEKIYSEIRKKTDWYYDQILKNKGKLDIL